MSTAPGSALEGRPVAQLVAGGTHTLALCRDGTTVAWGRNQYGQLGDGTTTDRNLPVVVSTAAGSALAGKTVLEVAAGASHSLARCSDGTAVAWGRNVEGQLGDYSFLDRSSPVRVGMEHNIHFYDRMVTKLSQGSSSDLSLALSTPGPAVTNPTYTAVTLTSVTLGGTVTTTGGMAVLERGVVLAKLSHDATPRIGEANVMKFQTSGSTGIFTVPASGLQPSTEYAYAAYVTTPGGTAYSPLSTFFTSFQDLTWSYNAATDVPANALDASIASGGTLNLTLGFAPAPGTNLMVMRNTGRGFINGAFSNVLNGANVDLEFNGASYPFVAWYFGGDGNDLVLLWRHNALAGWGLHPGPNGERERHSKLAPAHVGTPEFKGKTIVSLAHQFDATGEVGICLVLCTDGKVYGYGDTHSLYPVTTHWPNGPMNSKTVVQVAAGLDHFLMLCSDGSVYSWGGNASGQLGREANSSVEYPVQVIADSRSALHNRNVVAVAAGKEFSLALCSDGSVAAWGRNHVGQLGDGTLTDRSIPVAVRADSASALQGKIVTAIAAGENHSLALVSDGSNGGFLKVWGSQGGAIPQHVPSTGDTLAGKTVIRIAAGRDHNLALTSDGMVAAWGDDSFGQTAAGGHFFYPRAVPAGSGSALNGRTVVAVGTGTDHSLALCSDGTVAAWGHNGSGALGDNSQINRSVPVEVNRVSGTSALFGSQVVALSGSNSSSLSSMAIATVVPHGILGGDTFLVEENSTDVIHTVILSDDVDTSSPRTFSVGGTDGGLFTISSGGALSFINLMDFENPGDANDDNVYELTVTATETGLGRLSATKAISVMAPRSSVMRRRPSGLGTMRVLTATSPSPR
ncbi:MAG: hypothetical protein NTV80_06425 [Verrucomicrobia bacterium]|nr:hypothetical protein [Verrucomicrobiota bacterium]